MVGTPQYMSPEQAELNQLGRGHAHATSTALGVLLYELLTGTTPLEAARLKQAALIEALRVIREEEPPRPSTRLSTSGPPAHDRGQPRAGAASGSAGSCAASWTGS